MTIVSDIMASVLSAALAAPESARAVASAVEPGPWWVSLIPAMPMLACILCGVCAAMRVKSKLPAWITVGCLGVSFALTVAMFQQLAGGRSVTVAWEWINIGWTDTHGHEQRLLANFGFYIDSLTCLWMLFVTGLATLIALYASEYMSHDVGAGYCRFFAAFSLFVFSMACLVMGDNLILLYLGWEGVGLCSYLLIGYFYKKPSAVAAAKKAFIMNRIGDLGLALGVFLTFVQFGSVEYKVILEAAQPWIAAAQAGHFSEIPATVQLIPILLMIGAFGKSAQLPLYVWLPDAMEGPTPVSALIHAATMVTAGVYLIARTYPMFLVSEYALPIVAWVGALTALVAATIGMAQFDIKRIMAYSTVSQLGYMFAGLGVLTSTGAAFHVFTHAFFKASLFLSCGAVMHGFAGQLDLRKLSGVGKMKGWMVVTVAMLVGCLNLSGFPFTAGFFSKDMILAETFVTPGMAPIGWILLLTAGLTAYYTFRVFFRVFVGPTYFEPGDEAHAHDDHGHGDHDHAHAPDADHSHGHGEFHPHAPGWAINFVLLTLTVLSIGAARLYFVGDHGGWVGTMVHDSSAAIPAVAHDAAHAADGHGEAAHAVAHGTFLGMDPHKVMYYVSGVIGFIGIGVAFFLHYLGRTTAATANADKLLPMLGPIPRLAQGKWFVDEFYDLLIVKPLHLISIVFAYVDKLLVDGLVNLFGWIPRAFGSSLRPLQGGNLHGYAVQMAGGVAVLLLIVYLASIAGL